MNVPATTDPRTVAEILVDREIADVRKQLTYAEAAYRTGHPQIARLRAWLRQLEQYVETTDPHDGFDRRTPRQAA